MSAPLSDDIVAQYRALTAGAGLVDLGPRTQIELTGADRSSFLHSFSTADIKQLSPGQGCEAFITSGQGKIVGYIYVFCGEETIALDTSGGHTDALIAHLDRYIIREDVSLADRSAERRELLLAGAKSAELLAALVARPLPQAALAHVNARIGAAEASIRRVEYTCAPSFFIACDAADAEQIAAAVTAAGAAKCSPVATEIVRIEAGTPVFGRDVTAENLPQEVNRNQQAISFTKGCYLGQETVARIDALGHVNRLLVGLRFDGGETPSPGAEAAAAGKAIARVTSSCWSPRCAAPLALAYVRTGHNEPGAKLSFEVGAAEVVKLPLE